MTQPKVVFFDVGNVLLFFSHEKAVREIAKVTGLQPALVQASLMDPVTIRQVECGQKHVADVIHHLANSHSIELPVAEAVHAFCDIFELNTEMMPLVDSLRSQDVRMILLSNMNEAHYDFISERFDLFPQFDNATLSWQVGAMKPDREIFEHALGLANCEPGECFYIDDIGDFVDTARTLSIDAEVFRDVPTFRKQLAARGLQV